MSGSINRVVSAAQNASRIANQAASAMSRGFSRASGSVNDLRGRLDSLRAYRDTLRIGVDTSRISAANVQLRNLQRQLDTVNRMNARADGSGGGGGGGSGGMLMGLGRRALPFLAASSMATGAAGFAQSGMDRETILARFEQFTGSAANAKNMVGQLNKYADATPYENGTMLDIGAKLSMNFGQDKVMPLVQKLGDVAGGDAERLQSIQLALSQVKQLGRMQGQDMMQFTNAQVPMMEYLAKAKGVKVGAVKGLMEDGKISYDDVEKALTIMTSKGGVFFGYMDRMSKTTFGRMSTLIGTVKNKFAELSLGNLPGLNEVIDWANKFVQNFGPAGDAIRSFAKAFSPVLDGIYQLLQAIGLIPKTGDGVTETVNSIATVFNTLAGIVKFVADVFNNLVVGIRALPFGDTIIKGLLLYGVFVKMRAAVSLLTIQMALMSVVSGAQSIYAWFSLLGQIPFRAIFTGMQGIKLVWLELNAAFALTPIGAIIIAIVALVAALTYAWQNSEKFREVVIRSWVAIEPAVMKVWGVIKGVGFGIWEIAKFIGSIFSGIWTSIVSVMDKMMGVWDGFSEKTKNVFRSIGEFIRDILAKATFGFSELAISAVQKFDIGYNSKGATDAVNTFEKNRFDNKDRSGTESVREAKRVARYERLGGSPAQKAQSTFNSVMGGADAGKAGKGAGTTDTVEGAKSKTININIKELVGTINNYVESGNVGKSVADQVLDALNRVLMSGDRLAVE